MNKRNTVVVNLYGGPGTGKSTTGAKLYGRLKAGQVESELVREYIKDWVWEGRPVKSFDQVYILAKQARKEQILYGAVDIIVTDAPMWLSPIYESKYGCAPYICDDIVYKFQKEAESRGVKYLHIFLNRVKPYNPNGRHQTAEEAKKIDEEIKAYLTYARIPFLEVDADEKADLKILKYLKKTFKYAFPQKKKTKKKTKKKVSK